MANPSTPEHPAGAAPPGAPAAISPAPAGTPVSKHFDTSLPDLPLSRRMQIPLIAAAVYSVVRLLGPTLRYEVIGWQHTERVYAARQRCIFPFWHRVILPIVWWARHRGVVIMNTTHFDGQWTRKVIEWLGYGTAQGSSTRGGLRGLAVMAQRLEEGRDCGFTIDGPRGPRYVAKPGPVMLARRSGCPIIVFHAGVERGKTFFRTWDHFLLPKPFSRVVLLFAPPIYVPPNATADVMAAKQAEMQSALERVRDIASHQQQDIQSYLNYAAHAGSYPPAFTECGTPSASLPYPPAEGQRAKRLVPKRTFVGSLCFESLNSDQRRELEGQTGLSVGWGAPYWLQLAAFWSNGKRTAWDIWGLLRG
ncbi:MAG: lysophospholipid acyltransferase family protein, partial [Acidobacteriia bacterium]|nr:lysophospholipid acyltransferase family protein [Terriglobia bacterium]